MPANLKLISRSAAENTFSSSTAQPFLSALADKATFPSTPSFTSEEFETITGLPKLMMKKLLPALSEAAEVTSAALIKLSTCPIPEELSMLTEE